MRCTKDNEKGKKIRSKITISEKRTNKEAKPIIAPT